MINFPSTAGAPTDGSFTHTENEQTWYWDGITWRGDGGASYTPGPLAEHTDVSDTAATSGQALAWNGTEWAPQSAKTYSPMSVLYAGADGLPAVNGTKFHYDYNTSLLTVGSPDNVSRLHVGGDPSTAYEGLCLSKDPGTSGDGGLITYGTGGVFLRADQSGPIAFGRGASEQARVVGSNNWLFGTTTGIGANCLMQILYTGNTMWGIGLRPNSDNTNAVAFLRGGDGAVIGSIYVTNQGVAYNVSSDVNLKKNIVDAPSALDSVNQIQIRSFDWKASDSHVDYGVIAQELAQHAPEAVTEGETWMVDYGRLTPRLIKAVQELSAELAALKEKLQ